MNDEMRRACGARGGQFVALAARMRFRQLTIVLVLAMACDLPRDTDGAMERARGGVLRVGVADHPPWDSVTTNTVSGIEPAVVTAIASTLGVTPTWRRGSESELLEALERRELDIVAAGLTAASPWATRVAFTRPYRTDQRGEGHVLALSPGENALLVHVERYLHDHYSVKDTVGRQ
jgi:polar amino acid transport system substrate-binding protein